jgi:hypothetical protein
LPKGGYRFEHLSLADDVKKVEHRITSEDNEHEKPSLVGGRGKDFVESRKSVLKLIVEMENNRDEDAKSHH